jgi:hypothetical protein
MVKVSAPDGAPAGVQLEDVYQLLSPPPPFQDLATAPASGTARRNAEADAIKTYTRAREKNEKKPAVERGRKERRSGIRETPGVRMAFR